MEVELAEIAAATGARLQRNGLFESLGFLNGAGNRRLSVLHSQDFVKAALSDPTIAAILTTEDIAQGLPETLAVATSPNPLGSFYAAHLLLLKKEGFYWKSFKSRIDPRANLHPSAHVAEQDVEIGPGACVGPKAVIMAKSILEESVVIGPGTVIGAEGLQIYDADGSKRQLPHGGGVRLRKGVEVQANSTIDRALFNGCTDIGEDTKIDGNVYIGHNALIGRRGMITAGVVIGGSVVIGDDVRIGLNATIANGVTLGEGAFVPMAEAVTRDVPAGMAIVRNAIMPAEKLARIVSDMKDRRPNSEG
jgi:UDP-3-O-[3-hydroxymyristoyl] glucosamine N-acyltransferase